MLQTRCLVCAVLAAICTAAPQVQAQAIIPPELRQTSSALSTEEDRLVRDVIAAAVKDLQSDDPQQVMQARRRLIDPLELPNTSEIFEQAYSSHLKLQLPDALGSSAVLVRLNAVIVASHLTDRTAIELLAGPMADEAPAVRYQAAKALGAIVQNARYSDDASRRQTQMQALEMLRARAAAETMPEIWRPLFESFSVLQIPEARLAVLDALNQQVDAHAAQPHNSVAAEHAALVDAYRRIVEQSLQPGGVDAPTAQRLGRVAFRYLLLSAKVLAENGDLEAPIEASYEQMVSATDTVLRWLVRDYLRLPVALPPAAAPKIRDRLWAELVLDAGKWKALLTDSRLDLTDDELEVTAASNS